ncbi:H-NS family nucleoid-associated regulatory protein [Paraburkholderia monticola]|uniref:H-NS family nucleoid-associated regulatory protein n=1 Tax=Paraburkholderia monticola TaxID=1399968 RepID=UPI00094FCE55
MVTLKTVHAKIAKLQAQADALLKKDTTAVVEKIHGLMEKHGLTVADIVADGSGSKKRGRKPRVKAAVSKTASAALYRRPKTGAT